MEEIFLASDTVASQQTSGYLHLAVVVMSILTVISFARWLKYKKRKNSLSSPEDYRDRYHNQDKYRDAADQALVELIETGREISAQIDNKIRLLNKLVKDADDKINSLKGLLKADINCQVEENLDNNIPILKDSKPQLYSDLQARIIELNSQGKSKTEIANLTGSSILEIEFVITHLNKDRGLG